MRPSTIPQQRKIAYMLWSDFHQKMGSAPLSSIDLGTASEIIRLLSSHRDEDNKIGLNQARHLNLII